MKVKGEVEIITKELLVLNERRLLKVKYIYCIRRVIGRETLVRLLQNLSRNRLSGLCAHNRSLNFESQVQ